MYERRVQQIKSPWEVQVEGAIMEVGGGGVDRRR